MDILGHHVPIFLCNRALVCSMFDRLPSKQSQTFPPSEIVGLVRWPEEFINIYHPFSLISTPNSLVLGASTGTHGENSPPTPPPTIHSPGSITLEVQISVIPIPKLRTENILTLLL